MSCLAGIWSVKDRVPAWDPRAFMVHGVLYCTHGTGHANHDIVRVTYRWTVLFRNGKVSRKFSPQYPSCFVTFMCAKVSSRTLVLHTCYEVSYLVSDVYAAWNRKLASLFGGRKTKEYQRASEVIIVPACSHRLATDLAIVLP